MADLKNVMGISADDIKSIMGVSKDDIKSVMGFEIPVLGWYGDRGLAAGYHRYGRSSGTWYTNNIQYRSISSSSHCAKFGEFAAIGSDANVSVWRCSAVSGGGRGMFQGGDISITESYASNMADKMWYVTIASTGDASVGTNMPSFLYAGWLPITGHYFNNEGGGSNGVTGIVVSEGYGESFYNTIASTAAATNGGNLTSGQVNHGGGGGNLYMFQMLATTDGTDGIEYMSYSTPANNAAVWGDLTAYGLWRTSCSSDTRTVTWGYYGNGNASPITNGMEYWEHASTGNAAVFGNNIGPTCSTNSTTFGKYSGMAMSNGTRGERWSGWAITYTPSAGNCNYMGDMNVDYITIASTGNAADSGYNFADLDSTGVSYTDHYGVGISG